MCVCVCIYSFRKTEVKFRIFFNSVNSEVTKYQILYRKLRVRHLQTLETRLSQIYLKQSAKHVWSWNKITTACEIKTSLKSEGKKNPSLCFYVDKVLNIIFLNLATKFSLNLTELSESILTVWKTRKLIDIHQHNAIFCLVMNWDKSSRVFQLSKRLSAPKASIYVSKLI